MIREVIDRHQAKGSGLGDDPRFRKVRQGLPERALLSLFVNPRLIERLLADSSRSSKTPRDRLATTLSRYLGAVAQVGFAVQWRDGIVIHSHEVLEPARLDPWLKRWLTRPPEPSTAVSQVPPTAVALISANLDFSSLVELAGELIPEADRGSLATWKIAAQGLLLGHDPMAWVLPRLRPNALIYLDIEPSAEVRPSFPWVVVVGWQGEGEGQGQGQRRGEGDGLAAPIDNALRTLFAFIALDSKDQDEPARVETRAVGTARLTSLTRGSRGDLAYRTDHDRLTLGNSSAAVARFGCGPSNPGLAEIRAKYAADAETFAVVDTQRLAREFRRLRERLARDLAARSHRPVDATGHDLDQLIEFAVLFRAFTFATRTVITKDAVEIHRSMSLIAH